MPSLNSENPFVSNPYYFAGYTNRTIYKETIIYLVRTINDNALSVVGLMLSSLVFYLIFNQMPSNFKPYRKMLVLSTSIDSFMMAVNFCLQVRLKIANGFIMYTFMGWVSNFGFALMCPASFFQSINASLGCAILPVQYYYRYHTVVKNQSPSILQTFCYFCMSVIFSLFYGFNTIRMFCLSDINADSTDFSNDWFEEVPIPVLIGGSINRTSYSLHQSYGTGIVILYYFVALWFALLTMRALNKKFESVNVSNSTKKMQAQVGRTLLAQSFIPLFTSVLPRMASPMLAYFHIQSRYSGELVIMLMYWFPILSLLSTIICIVPFRRYCLGFLPWSRHYRQPTSSVKVFVASPNTNSTRVRVNTLNRSSTNVMI